MSIGEQGEEGSLYFVHGTTTLLWQGGDVIDPVRGKGDFGAGFYTFEDLSWGRRSAAIWARRKADDSGGRPLLLRFAMSRAMFAALDREDISDESLDTAYQLYARSRLTGREVVVGSVGRTALNGERVPDRRWPRQYKFEGSGITKLGLVEVIPLP